MSTHWSFSALFVQQTVSRVHQLNSSQISNRSLKCLETWLVFSHLLCRLPLYISCILYRHLLIEKQFTMWLVYFKVCWQTYFDYILIVHVHDIAFRCSACLQCYKIWQSLIQQFSVKMGRIHSLSAYSRHLQNTLWYTCGRRLFECPCCYPRYIDLHGIQDLQPWSSFLWFYCVCGVVVDIFFFEPSSKLYTSCSRF